ncbi:hypothetical protein AB3R30_11355 [Leptolyngbyaceae cyanobacterium UHCC 1019]
MNDDELQEQRLNQELENISFNQLNELGNRAVQLGLIIGHGFRGGQYEILSKQDVVLLPPKEAQQYLQNIVDTANQ